VSLLHYAVKALIAAGVPINLEVAVGASVPIVLWSVWRITRKVQVALDKK
jgi:uncharacterized membrane-anchored protein